jgi:hypothetical protein
VREKTNVTEGQIMGAEIFVGLVNDLLGEGLQWGDVVGIHGNQFAEFLQVDRRRRFGHTG